MIGFPRGNGVGPSAGAITHDATLTGNGTLLSPLSVVQNYVTLTTSGQTITGTKTWNADQTFGAKIIAPTIGPVSGQQHTIPAVASDTLVVLNAAQTIANKTLGSNLAGGGFEALNFANPTTAQSLTTKAYVDSIAQGMDPKASVRAASSTNLNLSSMPAAVGGVTLSNGDSFLAMGQTAGAENGWYTFNGAGSAATRRSDADTSAKVTSGAYSFVSEGTLGGTSWFLVTPDPIVLGTTALTFSQSFGPGTYTAGTGLTLTGTQFSIDSTVVTLNGTQTLQNKTYSGGTVAGTIAGTPTWSGLHTFNAGVSIATGQAVTGAAELSLVATGSNPATITANSILGYKLWPSGGISMGGNNVDPGAQKVVIGTTSGSTPGILFRQGSSSWTAMEISSSMNFGNTAFGCVFKGTAGEFGSTGVGVYISTNASKDFILQTGLVNSGIFKSDGSEVAFGNNDNSASAADYLIRGTKVTGPDAAGKTLKIRASLGTGTGTPGIVQIEGGEKVGSGSGQHSVVTLAQFQDSDTDGDTMFLVSTRKSGVQAVERVTLVAAASVAGSGRNFLSVS